MFPLRRNELRCRETVRAEMILKAITAELHRYDGALDWENPIRVRFEFDDGPAIRVCGASDGETVILDDQLLQPPFDLDEYGSFEHVDAANALAPTLIGSSVEPSPIVDEDGRPIGLALVRDGKRVFYVRNIVDDLQWGVAT